MRSHRHGGLIPTTHTKDRPRSRGWERTFENGSKVLASLPSIGGLRQTPQMTNAAGPEVHVHINLTGEIAEQVRLALGQIGSATLRTTATLVEERIMSGEELTGSDVVAILRNVADVMGASKVEQ